MNLLQLKDLLLESGLASELALVLGVLLICAWSGFAAKSAFGISFWIALFAIGASFFLSDYTPAEGSFHSLRFYFWSGYLKKYFGVAASVALFGFLEWRNERSVQARTELLVLLLLSQLSLSILIQAKSLWLMFMAAEGFSFCAYAFARPTGKDKSANESVLKYFASGSLASAIGLFGLTWILGFQGTIIDPGNDFLVSVAFFPVAGAVFYLSFLLFKLGGFPFHFWVQGVYENAPTPFAGFIASAPKVGAAFALLNVVAEIEPNLTFPLVVLALIGSVFGNLAALRSVTIKNLIAFSAVGQAGFLLIPAIFSKQISGAESQLLIFGIGYAVVVQAAFSAVQYFENHLKDGLSVTDFSGQFHSHPLPSVLFIILVISLIGLPPTIGFSGKLLIFAGILKGSNLFSESVLYLLFGMGLGTTIISFGYYFRIPYFLIFRNRLIEDHTLRNSSASLMWLVLATLFVFLAFFSPAAFFPFP
jgi:NADH-quinone oxidoreductase subunit N